MFGEKGEIIGCEEVVRRNEEREGEKDERPHAEEGQTDGVYRATD